MDPDELLRLLVERGGSDLFLAADGRPAMRLDGDIVFIPGPPVPQDAARSFFERVLDESQRAAFQESGDAEAAYEVPGLARFRVSVYSQRGRLAFVCRAIAAEVPDIEKLGLPAQQLLRLARHRRGIVLVTGPAGSGRSTTLAAMIQWLNNHEPRHVITLEDPVEFVLSDARSRVDQRELGVDTVSFAAALRRAVRQSPDLVMVGELRDRETVEAALDAAETGHLVLSTLHTLNAPQTVDRLLLFFPPELHPQIRHRLSQLLEGIVSQRLVPRSNGRGRVPAVELMIPNAAIRDHVLHGRTKELTAAIAENADVNGSQTLHQALARLVRSSVVSQRDAVLFADDPDLLDQDLRGPAKFQRGARPPGAFAAGTS